MKLNERGSTLVTVLLVLMVFSVLGVAVMSNVMNENKRVHATESNVQARYLAENGLTYFESSFKSFIDSKSYKINSNQDDVGDLSLYVTELYVNSFQTEKPVGDPSNPSETTVKAEMIKENGEDIIKVISTGTAGSFKKKLIGYYKPNIFVDIDGPTYDIANFSVGGKAIDFSQMGLASLSLLNLLKIDVIKPTGSDTQFYQVPTDNILNFKLLGSLLNLDLGLGDRFKTMKENRVVATREPTILNGKILNDFVTINLFSKQSVNDTNVMINGFINTLSVGDIPLIKDYQDMTFKKLGVMGFAVIQKDRNDVLQKNNETRTFVFDEGLYVNKSLLIRGSDSVSPKVDLKLQGNMVAMGNLDIKDINLLMGYKNINNKQGDEAIYVHGDVTIDNACINAVPDSYEFRLFAKGKITIKNTTDCMKSNVLLYAEDGIRIITNNQAMTIKGGLIGELDVDNPSKLKVVTEGQFLNRVNFAGNLMGKGRSY
jgi:Tfp pilus assembly protein PilX